MAMTGPKHYRDGMRFYNQVKRKNNPAEKAALMQEAIFNMLAAVVASNVHTGRATPSGLHDAAVRRARLRPAPTSSR